MSFPVSQFIPPFTPWCPYVKISVLIYESKEWSKIEITWFEVTALSNISTYSQFEEKEVYLHDKFKHFFHHQQSCSDILPHPDDMPVMGVFLEIICLINIFKFTFKGNDEV